MRGTSFWRLSSKYHQEKASIVGAVIFERSEPALLVVRGHCYHKQEISLEANNRAAHRGLKLIQ